MKRAFQCAVIRGNSGKIVSRLIMVMCGVVVFSVSVNASQEVCISKPVCWGFPSQKAPDVATMDQMLSKGVAFRVKQGTRLIPLKSERGLVLVKEVDSGKTFWVGEVTLICDPREIEDWQEIYKLQEKQDEGTSKPIVSGSEAEVCTVLAGEPAFKTEDALDTGLRMMADQMDAGHSFPTTQKRYQKLLDRFIRNGKAREIRENARVSIIEKKDFAKGDRRLSGVKIKVRQSDSSEVYWVFLDSLECE